jgi:hypothetical protein
MKAFHSKLLRRASVVGLGVLIVLVPPSLLRPDAIVITKAMTATTIAEIFVEESSVTVELEIGVADLDGFRNLLPDELYERLGHDPEPLIERVPRFFQEDLMIRPDDGDPIPGRVSQIEARRRLTRDEITGEPLPDPEGEGEPVVFMRLVYPLGDRPETLVIEPPRNASGQTAANIGFVTYHRGLPVNDFRYLGIAEQLNLDWRDPWYSQFNNRNLRRQYYAPISAFLYIEPFEVRKEIVFRPKDLQVWVDLGLEGQESIPAEQWDEIKQRASEFLAEKNPLTIDGRPAEGQLDRVHFIYRNLRTSGVLEVPEDLDIISATMGVIFVYPTDGLPQEVDMEWELFTDRIDRVPSSATDEAGPLPYVLAVDDNVLRWQNFLTNPTDPGQLVAVQTPPGRRSVPLTLVAITAAVGLLGLIVRFGQTLRRGHRPPKYARVAAVALLIVVSLTGPRAVMSGRVSDDDAQLVVTALLQNTYRAFDFKDEGAIYDVLARSAAGELLTDIYLETRRSLELENQGGARVKVKEVDVLDSEAEPLDGELGFISHLTWNVSGSVGHWGHIHTRTNQYEARLTVKSIDGAWKLMSLELLQEQRL